MLYLYISNDAMAGIRKYQDPVVGDVTIRKSDKARRMSIKVHPVHGITVTVPAVVPYKVAECFLVLKRNWVVKTIEKQKEKYYIVMSFQNVLLR